SQCELPGGPGIHRPAILRHVAGWRATRDCRTAWPSLVRWCAVSPGTKVQAVRPAPAVRRFHRGRRASGAVGVTAAAAIDKPLAASTSRHGAVTPGRPIQRRTADAMTLEA